MKEIWRDILNYEGLYKSSDIGKIKNRHGRILKPYKRSDGHLEVSLHKDGASKTFKVHRLVLETFVGPCPPGMECRHLDGNPLNNKLNNLCWVRLKKIKRIELNMEQAIKGSRNHFSKLNEWIIRIIKRLLEKGN